MTDDEPCETFKVLKSSAAEVHCWAAGSLAFSFPTFGTWLSRLVANMRKMMMKMSMRISGWCVISSSSSAAGVCALVNDDGWKEAIGQLRSGDGNNRDGSKPVVVVVLLLLLLLPLSMVAGRHHRTLRAPGDLPCLSAAAAVDATHWSSVTVAQCRFSLLSSLLTHLPMSCATAASTAALSTISSSSSSPPITISHQLLEAMC